MVFSLFGHFKQKHLNLIYLLFMTNIFFGITACSSQPPQSQPQQEQTSTQEAAQEDRQHPSKEQNHSPDTIYKLDMELS